MSVLFMLTLALSSALAAFVAVAGYRRWALRRRILDLPNERSSHVQPTPRGAGIMVVGVCLLAWSACLYARWVRHPLDVLLLAPLAGILIVAGISWLDDVRRNVSVGLRFLLHTAAAVLVISVFGWWQEIDLPFLWPVDLGWMGLALAIFWVVGLVNAYNFMDGIDGIAGLQAVVAALGWAVVSQCLGATTVLVICLPLAGAAVGFLVLNWSPAKVFLGDVGSAFFGFFFALLPIAVRQVGGFGDPGVQQRLPLTGLLMVAPFVTDAAYTFFRRLLKRENVFAAHRSHLYQRLVISGWSHQRVTLCYGALAVMTSSAGCWYLVVGGRAATAAAMAALLFSWLAPWVMVRRRERGT